MGAIHTTPASFRTFVEQAGTPATPATAGQVRLFVTDTLELAWVDDAGNVYAGAGAGHNHDPTPLEVATDAGTAITLDLGDAYDYLRLTAAGAVTVTVPTNAAQAFDVGTVVQLYAAGAGGVTIAGDTGVTVNGAGTLAQYESAVLVKVAVDEWDLVGAATA